MRRPQASWVGPPPERVGMPHAGVGISRGLPPSLGFGALSPSITTGSPFSGAVAPRGMNVVHPEPPPTFQAPSYGNVGSPMQTSHIAPLIAALMATGVGAPMASARTPGVTSALSAPAPPPKSNPLSGYPGATPAMQTAATANQASYSSGDPGFGFVIPRGGITTPGFAQKTSAGGSNFIKSY
jgi:hypothetical protein